MQVRRKSIRELAGQLPRSLCLRRGLELSHSSQHGRWRVRPAGRLVKRRDGFLLPLRVSRARDRDGDLLNAGDRIAPQREREPACILVVIDVAGHVDAGRTDLVERHVADEIGRIHDPVFADHCRWPEPHPVQVELTSRVRLALDPPQHIVDRGLVGADVECLRPLALRPRGDTGRTTHHPLHPVGQVGSRVETRRRPVRMRARVIPEEPGHRLVVQRGIVRVGRRACTVLVFAGDAAAGASFVPPLPAVDPFWAHAMLVTAVPAQHVPLAGEVDRSVHADILVQRSELAAHSALRTHRASTFLTPRSCRVDAPFISSWHTEEEPWSETKGSTVVTIGTWNLENLFRPGEDSGPETDAEYQAKLEALAATIADHSPDVLAVQEVGDPEALEDLASRLEGTWNTALADSDSRGSRMCFLAQFALASMSCSTATGGRMR